MTLAELITDPEIVTLLIAIGGVVTAWMQTQQARREKAEKEAVATFYDQGNTAPVKKEVVDKLDPRTYTMSQKTLDKLLDNRLREDQVRIREQVEKAEIDKTTVYIINFLEGWYKIEYGALVDWEIYSKMESEKRPVFFATGALNSYRGVVYLKKIPNAKPTSEVAYYEETSGVALSEKEVEEVRRQVQVVIKT